MVKDAHHIDEFQGIWRLNQPVAALASPRRPQDSGVLQRQQDLGQVVSGNFAVSGQIPAKTDVSQGYSARMTKARIAYWDVIDSTS